ncbi:MAG TPA: hypothetical protein VES88_11755 [Gemmatimonadaceae bacterium]|nr:hypothetical protein [Gemmatimonadaceae bacterium]
MNDLAFYPRPQESAAHLDRGWRTHQSVVRAAKLGRTIIIRDADFHRFGFWNALIR